MAGLTISSIRDALKTQLAAGVSVGREVDVKAYRVTGARVFPRITVEPDRDFIDYWVTGTSTGVARLRFGLVIEAGGPDESARRRLDDMLSVGTGNEASVVDALMSDVTLGGLVDTCHATGVDVDDDNAAARIRIEVHLRKVGANV